MAEPQATGAKRGADVVGRAIGVRRGEAGVPWRDRWRQDQAFEFGDADREAVATSLREHFAHGRLTIEEFQQRLDAAFAAKTDLDLAKITSDLPHAPAPTAPWPPQRAAASSRGAASGSYRINGQGYWRLRSRAWAVVSMAVMVIALILVIGLFRPFGWLGHLLPRPVLALVAILIFLRQALSRAIRGRGWPLHPRGRGRRF